MCVGGLSFDLSALFIIYLVYVQKTFFSVPTKLIYSLSITVGNLDGVGRDVAFLSPLI